MSTLDAKTDALIGGLRQAAWALEEHLYEERKKSGSEVDPVSPQWMLFCRAQDTRITIDQILRAQMDAQAGSGGRDDHDG